MQVSCADVDCRFNADGACITGALNINSDRFCVGGRRRDRVSDLMCQTNPMCRKTNGGWKANHGRVLK